MVQDERPNPGCARAGWASGRPRRRLSFRPDLADRDPRGRRARACL